jgi:hypothetical protein
MIHVRYSGSNKQFHKYINYCGFVVRRELLKGSHVQHRVGVYGGVGTAIPGLPLNRLQASGFPEIFREHQTCNLDWTDNLHGRWPKFREYQPHRVCPEVRVRYEGGPFLAVPGGSLVGGLSG